MKHVIDVGLPQYKQPFSWMVRSGSVLYTSHGPVRADGSLDTGTIEQQTRLTLDNLKRAVENAGCTMDDVAQVLLYLSDVNDMPVVDAIYRAYFRSPYPNRSTAGVALVAPGMKIELVAYVGIRPIQA